MKELQELERKMRGRSDLTDAERERRSMQVLAKE